MEMLNIVYGVVAFLPNSNRRGNVLILEGTSMLGTESAWDFVADDSQLLPFSEPVYDLLSRRTRKAR